MAHRLEPKNGKFLSPGEVVRRLTIEFPFLQASREEGIEHVRNMLTYLLELKRRGRVPVEESRLSYLEGAEGESIGLLIADEPYPEKAYLQCCVMPEEPLFFDYVSADHQAAALPLLERCASALSYEISGL